jgi:8-oxo-dGTP diphosphatase
MPRAGGWDLPGGAMEYGENPSKAVERELAEETGLKARDARLISAETYPSQRGTVPTLLLGYTVTVDDDEITLSSEHDEFVWVLPAELAVYKLPERYEYIINLCYQSE